MKTGSPDPSDTKASRRKMVFRITGDSPSPGIPVNKETKR